ncbi:hypothetical protein SAMN05660653_01571 [Desulfonatronum thiosulfatophilum]|uniref:Uncharacterized protein n=1 Tax=Desulfonatronum thiosulfatophilum TaxID=617002 RepID=A0A1G6CJC5_9BACT|nr:hypothetical protein SAMN05660653_01571 [Desulfonatronum thiosulfatophilum]
MRNEYMTTIEAEDTVGIKTRVPARHLVAASRSSETITMTQHKREMRMVIAKTLSWCDYFMQLQKDLHESFQSEEEAEQVTEDISPRDSAAPRRKSSRRVASRDRRSGFRTARRDDRFRTENSASC